MQDIARTRRRCPAEETRLHQWLGCLRQRGREAARPRGRQSLMLRPTGNRLVRDKAGVTDIGLKVLGRADAAARPARLRAGLRRSAGTGVFRQPGPVTSYFKLCRRGGIFALVLGRAPIDGPAQTRRRDPTKMTTLAGPRPRLCNARDQGISRTWPGGFAPGQSQDPELLRPCHVPLTAVRGRRHLDFDC